MQMSLLPPTWYGYSERTPTDHSTYGQLLTKIVKKLVKTLELSMIICYNTIKNIICHTGLTICMADSSDYMIFA